MSGEVQLDDRGCVRLLQHVAPRMGLRWQGFRRVRGQVRKRLARRLRELHVANPDAYERYLDAHPSEWAVLDALCRVTITRFWRDRRVFDALRDEVLPRLARAARERGEPAVRAWSAGCGSGEEPWSVKLAYELGPASREGLPLELIATDADARLLERARAGSYQPGTLRELPKGFIAIAFEPNGTLFRLRDRFRTGVCFCDDDVRGPPPPGAFDLVLCRNLVLTYFDRPVQERVMPRLLARLVDGGAFVIGSHECWPADLPGVPRLEPLPGVPSILLRAPASVPSS